MRSTSLLTFYSLLISAFTSAIAPPPSQDCWYDQPKNIGSYKPGDIVRSRSLAPELESLTSLPVNVSVKAVSQYLFRTTDNLGAAAAAVVTLIEPHNSNPSKVLGYQTYYDSANVDCSPSYTLQTENDTLTGSVASISLDPPFIAAALNLGWWVYTTDYEGLNAEYTTGLQSGFAVLDSTRAVLNIGPSLGLSRNPNYALWGYSGGSLASTWAAELQPSYAPELHFAGVAVGGTVPNVSSVLHTIHNTSAAGLTFSGLYGISKAFPDMKVWLEENLVPAKKESFYSIADGCLAEASAAGAYKDIYSYFVHGKASFDMEVPRSIFHWYGQLGIHGTPSAPMFVYKAIGDEISPVTDTDEVVAEYCVDGANIEYHRNSVGDHESESVAGSGIALTWLSERLNGVKAEKGCHVKDVTVSSLSSETLALFGETLYAILEAALSELL
ncbi:hypothetical protein N7466_009194 [Penicillium verhagenii]|uniref:uncharacterized protein n=1 Tax=Penicillium verhagenii TaxID=1562060 RepID=UPI0025455093|nr:uncharacterized protein N7466_009194 [Penicillium verhagenii]KAJ5920868.1 hypothetical protein N7466_009194 [Penicillium verhagenii]